MRIDEREKLTERARQLIKADALSTDEIEQIVDTPHLFAAIRARIEAEKSTTLAINKNEDSNWQVGIIESRQLIWQNLLRPVSASAFALLIISLVLTWYFNKPFFSERSETQIGQNQLELPNKELNISKMEVQPINEKRPDDVSQKDNLDKSFSATVKNTRSAKSNVRIIRKIKAAETTRQSKQNTPKSRSKTAVPRDFYQLAFADDLEDGENKQIVRVKMSPTALAQLGVAAPVSSDLNNSFTADLLLGENGVPRAIRFVK